MMKLLLDFTWRHWPFLSSDKGFLSKYLFKVVFDLLMKAHHINICQSILIGFDDLN
jgi:hypothetical protein